MTSEQLQKIIINEIDLEGIPPDVVGVILVRLTKQAFQQCMLDTYDALAPDDQKEFKRLMAASDSIAVRAFIEEKLPAIDALSILATKKIIAQYKKLRHDLSPIPVQTVATPA